MPDFCKAAIPKVEYDMWKKSHATCNFYVPVLQNWFLIKKHADLKRKNKKVI